MSKKPEPSPQMLEVYLYIIKYVEDNGFQPIRTEIAAHFGITVNAINSRLDGLVERGFIEMGAERSIRLLGVKFKAYPEEGE